MTRGDVIAQVLERLKPLGPFGDPDDREAAFEHWAQTEGPGNLDAFLDLLSHPPGDAERAGHPPDAFEFAITSALARAGAADRGAFVARAAPLLADPQARPAIIETLGLVGGGEAEAALAPLADARDLTEDEAVRLACAFGDAAGPNARPLLDTLRAHVPQDWTRVAREIDIAVSALPRETL